MLESISDPLVGLDPSKIHGQAYDGAAVMSSNRAGVQAKIKEFAPLALYTHCYSHYLNLSLASACKLQKPQFFESTMEAYLPNYSHTKLPAMPNTGQPNQDEECTTDGKLILSYGWLCNWKRRHGVFSVRLHGKAGSADQEEWVMDPGETEMEEVESIADIAARLMGQEDASIEEETEHGLQDANNLEPQCVSVDEAKQMPPEVLDNAHAIAKAGRPFCDKEWMCAPDEKKGLDVGASWFKGIVGANSFMTTFSELLFSIYNIYHSSALNRENLKSSCAAVGMKFQAPSRLVVLGGCLTPLKKLWNMYPALMQHFEQIRYHVQPFAYYNKLNKTRAKTDWTERNSPLFST
eukprot:Em0020g628a